MDGAVDQSSSTTSSTNFPFVLGPTEGAENLDLFFIPYKLFPQLFRPKKANITASTLGTFGPDHVFPLRHFSPPWIYKATQRRLAPRRNNRNDPIQIRDGRWDIEV